MSVRRTHNHGIGLAREIEIGGETARPGEQPRVFDPSEGTAHFR